MAKQKKETEDKLRRSVENATEKAKVKTAKLVENAVDKQKQVQALQAKLRDTSSR